MSVLLEQIKLCRAAIVIMLQIIQALHSSPGGLFSTAQILFFLTFVSLGSHGIFFFFFLHILPLTNQNCVIALGRTATGIITSSVSDSLIVNPDRLSLLFFFFFLIEAIICIICGATLLIRTEISFFLRSS